MTVILVLVYIALSRIVLRLFEHTKVSWFLRIVAVLAVNIGATMLMYDYISSQFEWIRKIQDNYYGVYKDVKEGRR